MEPVSSYGGSAYDDVSRSLKLLAVRFNVPILGLVDAGPERSRPLDLGALPENIEEMFANRIGFVDGDGSRGPLRIRVQP